MELDAKTLDDVVARLRRVEGQVGGVIKMIESGRECRDVVSQISAASKALDQAGFRLLVLWIVISVMYLRHQSEPLVII